MEDHARSLPPAGPPERRQPRSAEQVRQHAEDEARQRGQELELAQREIIMRLSLAAEYRDDHTGGHTDRVSQLAAHLAQKVGLSGDQVELIRLASRLHDIGKIGIPDEVLLKRGNLTEAEFEVMKRHTSLGARLLSGSRIRLLRLAGEIAERHHERWDGSGYPSGLRGTDIPLPARIVALADAWDALMSERPYKPAWSAQAAREELARQAGRQFDPELTRIFLDLVSDEAITRLPIPQPDRRARPPEPRPPAPALAWPKLPALHAEPERLPPVLPEGIVTRIQTLNDQAWALRDTDIEQSREQAHSALVLAEQHNDVPGLIASLRTLALDDLRRGEHRQALHRLSRAHGLLPQTTQPVLERDLSNLSGWLYEQLANSDKATQFLLRSRELSVALGDLDGQATALLNLGIVAIHRLSDPHGAESYFRQALDLQRQTANLQSQTNTLYNLADALMVLGQFEEARTVAQEAVDLARATGNTLLEMRSVSALARTHTETGDTDHAQTLHDEALQLLDRSGLDLPETRFWMELHRAQNLTRLDRHADAEVALEALLTRLDRREFDELRIEVHRALTELYTRMHDYRRALTHASTTLTLKEAYDHQQNSERTQAMLLQFEVDRAQSEAELYRLRTVELAGVNRQLERADEERTALLETLQQQQALLERQVREDALSGLYNRRHTEVLLAQAFSQHSEQLEPFVVAMIDIDHFKRVNDGFSHQVGDEVIRVVGRLLKRHLREDDTVGRYGGEEFVMLLPNTPLEHAWKVMERLRVKVQDHNWELIAPGLQVTLSIGAADNLNAVSWEKIVGAADAKLYEAKRTRNTVAC